MIVGLTAAIVAIFDVDVDVENGNGFVCNFERKRTRQGRSMRSHAVYLTRASAIATLPK